MRPAAGTVLMVLDQGIGLVEGIVVAGRILAVDGRTALLAGHAGSRREQAHHTAGYSLAVGSPAVAGRSSPGLAEVGSLVAGSHPVVRSLVVGEGIGLGAGIAGSPGCIDRKVQT